MKNMLFVAAVQMEVDITITPTPWWEDVIALFQ